MLKGIDPLLTPDLLHVLAAMGHGDEIALVDANFPATTCARRLVRLEGIDLVSATRAVVSVLPVDTFIETPIAAMAMVGSPEAIPPVQREVFDVVDAAEQRTVGVERVERFAFYERVRTSFGVIQTGEGRPYGCVILTKGVIFSSVN